MATNQTALEILKEAISNILSSDDTSLDQLQEIVDYIKKNRDELNKLDQKLKLKVETSGFKNLIINGDLRVNQRESISLKENKNSYNYDRWYYDGTYIIQYIEGLNLIKSGNYTLSWEGTANAFINGKPIENGSFLYLSEKSQVEIKFDTIDFKFVQLEFGTKKTNFEIRPYSIELDLCERYFQIIKPFEYVVSVGAAQWNVSPMLLPKRMRDIPNLKNISLQHVNSNNGTITAKYDNLIDIRFRSSLSNGQCGFHSTSEIFLDAEIY